jgi:hypothetical protein
MKMSRLSRIGIVSAALAALVLVGTVISPALGGPSLKQLVRKEVAKQLKGKQGPAGPPGTAGAQGAAGPFVEGVPPGSTLRGSWVLFNETAGTGEHLEVSVSFPFPLSTAPTGHFVGDGATPPGECPGSVSSPQASPGHLCVYQSGVDIAATEEQVFDPTLDTTSGAGKGSRFGFSVRATAGAAVVRTSGTWAATG